MYFISILNKTFWHRKRIQASLIAIVLGSAGFVPSAGATAEVCPDWAETKPYLADFFVIEGEQKTNLVENFNQHKPDTDYQPNIIGYINSESWDLIELFMFKDGCLLLDQSYPRTVVWEMMASYPVEISFDKSGETYTKEVEETLRDIDAAYERARLVDKEMVEKEGVAEDEVELLGDIGEVGEMD